MSEKKVSVEFDFVQLTEIYNALLFEGDCCPSLEEMIFNKILEAADDFKEMIDYNISDINQERFRKYWEKALELADSIGEVIDIADFAVNFSCLGDFMREALQKAVGLAKTSADYEMVRQCALALCYDEIIKSVEEKMSELKKA